MLTAGSLDRNARPSAAYRITLGSTASTVALNTESSSSEILPTNAPGRVTVLTSALPLRTRSAPDTNTQIGPAAPPSRTITSPGAKATWRHPRER